MGLLRYILGFTLIGIAWFNPVTLPDEFRLIIFLLGFDLLPLIPKVVVFGVDFLLEVFEPLLAWTVLIAIFIDILLKLVLFGPLYSYVLKPTGIFFIAYLNGLSIELCVALAILDVAFQVMGKRI